MLLQISVIVIMRNITKEQLEELILKGLSTIEIARIFNLSQSGIRPYLKKYNLKTIPFWSLENRYKFPDSRILEIWNKSDSVNQFLLNLGVGTSGGAWYHYKKRLIKLGIDLSDSRLNGRIRGGLKTAELKNKETIKRRIRLPRPTLKKSMDLADIPYKCNKCDLTEWRNKKLKLHIHHIDEDKTNNQTLNLEYLCPNCHGIEHYTEN